MPRSAAFLGGPSTSRFLGIIHLVEMSRYHLYQFQMLSAGHGTAPPGFEPGISVPQPDQNHEIDRLYRFMAIWFEVEDFFMSGKRFLDNCWCLLAEYFGQGVETIDTIGAALDEARISRAVNSEELKAQIIGDTYYCELRNAWNSWAKEFVDLRNYFEHEIPLGGMIFNECVWQYQEGQERFDTFVPDHIRSGNSRIPKQQFTFAERRSLRQYMVKRMEDIDILMETLFPVPHGHPLVEQGNAT